MALTNHYWVHFASEEEFHSALAWFDEDAFAGADRDHTGLFEDEKPKFLVSQLSHIRVRIVL